MLNGLEKTLERKDPAQGRHWQLAKETAVYGVNDESFPQGWPITTEQAFSFLTPVLFSRRTSQTKD